MSWNTLHNRTHFSKGTTAYLKLVLIEVFKIDTTEYMATSPCFVLLVIFIAILIYFLIFRIHVSIIYILICIISVYLSHYKNMSDLFQVSFHMPTPPSAILTECKFLLYYPWNMHMVCYGLFCCGVVILSIVNPRDLPISYSSTVCVNTAALWMLGN